MNMNRLPAHKFTKRNGSFLPFDNDKTAQAGPISVLNKVQMYGDMKFIMEFINKTLKVMDYCIYFLE